MLKSKLYLNDILRAIERIEKSTEGKEFKEFKSDNELVDATAMRLQIIGESISKLSSRLKEKYKIDWKRYPQTRNIISYSYFAVNFEILWSIVKKDIPMLKKQIKEILEKENA